MFLDIWSDLDKCKSHMKTWYADPQGPGLTGPSLTGQVGIL